MGDTSNFDQLKPGESCLATTRGELCLSSMLFCGYRTYMVARKKCCPCQERENGHDGEGTPADYHVTAAHATWTNLPVVVRNWLGGEELGKGQCITGLVRSTFASRGPYLGIVPRYGRSNVYHSHPQCFILPDGPTGASAG